MSFLSWSATRAECCLVFPWYLPGWRQPWKLSDVSSFCRAVPVCWDRAANFLSLVPCPKPNGVTLYTRSSLRRILPLPFRWKAGLCRSSPPLRRPRRMLCGVRLGNQVPGLEVKRGPSPGIGPSVQGRAGSRRALSSGQLLGREKKVGSRRELIIQPSLCYFPKREARCKW